jgi:hypothetical protein
VIGKIALGGLIVSATACAAVPPDVEDVPVHGAGQCDATKARMLAGKPATSELGSEALRLTGARSLRWIPLGSAVTMDYREDRLNIELDGRNRITAVRCG